MTKAASPLLFLLSCLLVIASGCESLNLGFTSPSESDDDFGLEEKIIDPPFIGEQTSFTGLNMVVLEGVGLVEGLDGTGEDPPSSQYRKALLDDMRRRNIKNPNQILSSPSTAIVIVRAYLPPLVKPGDKFDIEVRVPERSECTSLNGGWLMECNLTEKAVVAGEGVLDGNVMAKGEGPILVSSGERNSSKLSGMLLRGSVVGGARALKQRNMNMILNNDFRNYRNAKKVTKKIGNRFFSYNKFGHREPLATAKTPEKIVLQIFPRYKDNFPRYMRVIQNIAFRESDPEQQVRMERLKADLMIPHRAELAALQLEAIGSKGIPMLKEGLKSDILECRFRAAEALAYLGEPDGLETLSEVARDEPAFRVFAFTAMAASEDVESFIHLQELLSTNSLETRYGAFRTMTVLDEDDPSVRGYDMNDHFNLHLINSKNEPMIHLTHRQKAEIVLFGADQKIKTPISVAAGKHIMINSQGGDDKVVISRHQIGRNDRREVTTHVAEIIRTCVDMGASYPDIAQMLIQSERQHNLPGRMGIDKLPEAGRYYERAGIALATEKKRKSKSKIGRINLAPNLFPGQAGPQDSRKSGLNSINLQESDGETPTFGGFQGTDSSNNGLGELANEIDSGSMKEKQAKKDEKSSNPLKRIRSFWLKQTSNSFLYTDPEEVE